MLVSNRQEMLKKVWQEYISGGLPQHSEIRQIVLDSWERCRKWGVSPLQTQVEEVISFQGLDNRCAKNQELISVALPIMEKLYHFVAGSGFIVSLADNEGYLLKIIGDQEIASTAQNGNFKVGANWSERSAGTNAVGTTLVVGKPLQIFAYEHYCKCSHRWTCSAAPITNPADNRFIGILCLTGLYEKVHSHTLGMVYAAAYAIENELALRNAWTCCELANSQKEKIIASMAEGVIAVNEKGEVTQINHACCQLLGFSENRALNQDIYILLGPQNNLLKKIIAQKEEVTDQQISIYNLYSRQKIQCTVTSRQIKADYNELQGKVLLLSELKRTRKLVQQILRNQAHFTFDCIIGSNEKFMRSIDHAKAAAESTSNVLLLGESGTGKEMFAQAIHNNSDRKEGPFLAINCSGIPRDLIGSELFGYAEGAFTGAKKGGNPGKFELADGGTLFLDEIGDMPLELQSVLLRVIEEKRIMRIGSSEPISVDVRIISATNKNLWLEANKGNFRDDLFYRLNVLTINIVPLRERKDDIINLAAYFLHKLANQQQKPINNIAPDAREILLSYGWPGNVRQLQNIMERIVNTIKTGTITADIIPDEIKEVKHLTEQPSSHQDCETGNEKIIIADLLKKYNNNLSKVAVELNIARTTLYRKLKKHGFRNG
ncbi:MAG: Acetoin dehydrogenase operon transcriptional activator AcoR [Syntrophomonadaceae bacterium]|nr:Acetoin dehydrogenase operon transcriptional activator AcoR [Bacillota bacterium]